MFYFSVSGSAQSWVEIAFGTKSGIVRVIVQHPENVGQGLQVFRTFVAHTCPVIKIVLGEKHLITGMSYDYMRRTHTETHTRVHTHTHTHIHTHTHTRTWRRERKLYYDKPLCMMLALVHIGVNSL